MPLFSKGPTMKEQLRENDRQTRRTQRDLDKERGQLDRQEKQLEMEIKKAAKRGDKEACRILAKQIVQVRKQKTKTYAVGSKVQSVNTQSKLMASNVKMADAMGQSTKVMQSTNKVMNPEKTMQMLKDFERENMKMEMTDEMMSDAMDNMFEESGDEEEGDQIVNQVLDEIGIEISGKLADAPSARRDKLGHSSGITDDDLERQLAELKAL